MANLGDVIVVPEEGWQRITYERFKYTGTWAEQAGQFMYSTNSSSRVKFKMTGNKIRILGSSYATTTTSRGRIIIDGVLRPEIMNEKTETSVNRILIFEALNLNPGVHEIEMYCENSDQFRICGVDIDSNERFVVEIGDQLLNPESGWRRIDDTNTLLNYSSGWAIYTNAEYHKGQLKAVQPADLNSSVSFNFTGGRIRIFDEMHQNRGVFSISIDGVEETFSSNIQSSVSKKQILVYQKEGLDKGNHAVKISYLRGPGTAIGLDCIDIDSSGYLTDEFGNKSLVPPLTGNSSNSDFTVSATSVYSPSQDAWVAYDGRVFNSECWHSGPTGGSITLSSKGQLGVRYILFQNRDDATYFYQQDFDVEVSSDGTSYRKIKTFASGIGARALIKVDLGEEYIFKRIRLTGKSGSYITIGEIALLGRYVPKVEGMFKGTLGVYPNSSKLILTGRADSVEHSEVIYKVFDDGVEIMTGVLKCNEDSTINVDVSGIALGKSKIKVSLFVGSEYISSSTTTFMKSVDSHIIYDKSVTTKSIEIQETANMLVLSAKAEGSMIIPMLSLDSGTIWSVGDWEEEIIIPTTNKVKIMFLMSSDFILKAYGIGWFTIDPLKQIKGY